MVVTGGGVRFHVYTGAFMGMLAVSLFLQAWGLKDLRARLGGMFGTVFYIGFIAAAAVAVVAYYGFLGVVYSSGITGFLSIMYLVTVLFVICWQMIYFFINLVTDLLFSDSIINK